MLRIKIIDVGTPNTLQSAGGAEYQVLDVVFRDNKNQVVSKKLFSFRNVHVFKAASSWKKGTVLNVEDEVDSKGFNQWVDFDVVEPDLSYDDVPL